MTDDITREDVERVRDNLMDTLKGRLDEKGEEYRAGYIDAVIEMDIGLTEPEVFKDIMMQLQFRNGVPLEAEDDEENEDDDSTEDSDGD